MPKLTSVAHIGDGNTAELAATGAGTRQLLVGCQHSDTLDKGGGTLDPTGGDMTVTERLAIGEMTSGSHGEIRGHCLVGVPEPSAWLLLALGALSLAEAVSTWQRNSVLPSDCCPDGFFQAGIRVYSA